MLAGCDGKLFDIPSMFFLFKHRVDQLQMSPTARQAKIKQMLLESLNDTCALLQDDPTRLKIYLLSCVANTVISPLPENENPTPGLARRPATHNPETHLLSCLTKMGMNGKVKITGGKATQNINENGLRKPARDERE